MPTAQRELMVVVERIVRPIVASPARKMRMRSEFLAHLEAVYAEEIAIDGDEAAAMERATRRFGDPSVISAELRSGICITERVSGWFADLVSRKQEEGAVRYVVRISAIYAFVLAILLSVVIGGRSFFRYGALVITAVDVQIMLAAVAALTTPVAGLLYFGMQFSEEWTGPRRRSAMLRAAFGLFVSYPAALLVLSAISGGMALNSEKLIWNAAIGSVVMGLAGILLATVFAREQAQRRGWEELSLDAT